jgi:nucleoside-diphosphate-sugar epimerase
MKILVTGSSGHLGEAIIRLLQDSSHEYVSIDTKPSEYTTHVGSITDKERVKNCMEGIDAVLHTATLHKPHVVTHSNQEFIDTNVSGTLNLLEQAKEQNVKAFIYTSTTSTFGDMLTPQKNEPAIWITEETSSIPKNIYGVTKSAAEDLCQLFHRNHRMPCLVLKTSRFFPDVDDKKELRDSYEDANLKANEYLYRRVDIEDAATAHLLAIEKAPEIGFGKYIISATTPFTKQDLVGLHADAPSVVAKYFPDYTDIYQEWKMVPRIDRVYVNEKARTELGWTPKYDFGYILHCLERGQDYRSSLSIAVGEKAYHSEKFEHGPYPVHE